MRIALLSDIHANYHALTAVIKHAQSLGAQEFWNAGDSVGYGPMPDETVSLLRERGIVSVVGNYDLKALKFPEKKEKWRKSKAPEKFLAFEYAYEHMSESSREYLASLPKEIRLKREGLRFLLTHGSPADIDEYIGPNTQPDRLRELARIAKADVVVCGHSHRAWVGETDGVQFVNAGSVGRQNDGDPRACYAVMDAEDGSIAVEHYRIDYDIDATCRALAKGGMPELFCDMFRQGLTLSPAGQSKEE